MVRKLLLSGFGCIFTVISHAQMLRNPVIQGFHPDPSVTRVGDWFYLVNSSFQYFPGVPIYKSKNLVDWQQVGNILNRESQIPLTGANSYLGIYAPTLRYHKNKWYMITTNVGHGGNFLVSAVKPEGPWGGPVWLEQQGIDPSLYFEGDKCYMVSNPDNTITLCEIDPETGHTLSKSKPIWRGTGGRYPEGPHIYKKDGWYYLLISEGGTELAHKLTIARSRNIYGPYESNPSNPILTNCNLAGQNSQIQGTGHGDLVQAGDGSWWIVFLAYRNYGGSYHHLGRETCVAPVEWKSGEWPIVNNGHPIDTLMAVKHLLPGQTSDSVPTGNHKIFCSPGLEWIYIQNPDSSKYEINDKYLRLYGSVSSLTENNRPTFIGRRQGGPEINITTAIDASSLHSGGEAGITIYQKHDGHYDLFVRPTDNGKGQIVLRYQVKSLCQETKTVSINSINNIKLNVFSDGNHYRFSANFNGQDIQMGRFESSLISTEVVGGFTGVINGMFAKGSGYADFSYFD